MISDKDVSVDTGTLPKFINFRGLLDKIREEILLGEKVFRDDDLVYGESFIYQNTAVCFVFCVRSKTSTKTKDILAWQLTQNRSS